MRPLGTVFAVKLVLSASFSVVHAQVSPGADDAFEAGYWNTAIDLLTPQESTPEVTRMLAISYFQVQNFDQALPLLQAALNSAPKDLELNSAMMEVWLALRQFTEAERLAVELEELWKAERTHGAAEIAHFGRVRIRLESEDSRAQAKEDLYTLVKEAEQDLALRAADTLIEALLIDQELGPAYHVAQLALSRHPDPERAIRYAPFIPENQANSRFRYDLGYRLEYDDNVTFPDEAFGSGKDDYRHVLIADALYERPLSGRWSFYAQGNFLQSFHSDLDEFNQTRIAGSLAIGYMGQRTGWRVPLEITHVRLDGDAFRTSAAAIPGIYLQFGADFLGHLYARLQQDDYDLVLRPEEDRSGDVTGAGVLLTGQVTPRLQLRSFLEFNRYDTDGAWWERDEVRAFVHGEFEFTSRWLAAVAFLYKDEDYDNARPVFADVQRDKSKELFLNVTHKFAEKWWWRGQVSLIKHDSNIPLFDYDRNIYSIAVTRDF